MGKIPVENGIVIEKQSYIPSENRQKYVMNIYEKTQLSIDSLLKRFQKYLEEFRKLTFKIFQSLEIS